MDDVIRITEGDLENAQPLDTPGPLRVTPRDGRSCPMCGTVAAASARLCPGCGEAFTRETTDTQRRRYDPRQRIRDQEAVPFAKGVSVTLFVVSILAVLAPIVVFLGVGLVSLYHRPLKIAGAAYHVMAYAAIGISVVYSTLASIYLLT